MDGPTEQPASAPKLDLDPSERRVLGVLVEKELTTPDQYPLSINALASGASQKSNRDPVRTYAEAEVRDALAKLQIRHLAHSARLSGSRVERFGHGLREALGITTAELAVLSEILLRGPQTPGELRQRASRMAPIADQEALMTLLGPLMRKGFAVELPPSPGSRARRFGLADIDGASIASAAPAAPAVSRAAVAPAGSEPAPPAEFEQRLAELEERVARLEAAARPPD